MASLLNKDATAYAAERDRFLADLRRFHEAKGTPFRHTPLIEGKEIDLYELYWIVTAHGGWEKVNSRGGWEEIGTCFNVTEATANGSLAIKQVYLRYLDSYEKVHFLGEEEDDNDNWYNDEEDSRSRRQKAQKITSTVPLVYNHMQHNIADEHRATVNMCTNVYKKTDYDRLLMSLSSPLPNEQDFAINICTLVSNEGRATLKLAKCPKLLDLLLAHAGVYNHDSTKEYMYDLYHDERNYDLLDFWGNVCKDSSVRDLMLKYTKKKKRWNKNSDILALPTTEERLRATRERVEEEMSVNSNTELFSCGTGLGTQELSGQRILQVATILRQLSFEEDNAVVLAQNVTLLRFCLLCCSSKWSNLNQMGFDILGNIAAEVKLQQQDETCVTEILFSILNSAISSSDRFQVISSMDVLNKLCQNESNEEIVGKVLVDQRTYDQLVAYLSLHDMHLLVGTLECLYALSNLGENSCNAIVRTHGAVDALVSLITVEAQSYGPKACILMRVFETVPRERPETQVQQSVQTQQVQQLQQQQTQQTQQVVTSTSVHDQRAQITVQAVVQPNQTIGGKVVVTAAGQPQQQVLQIQRPGLSIISRPAVPQGQPGQQGLTLTQVQQPGQPRQMVGAIQRPQQPQITQVQPNGTPVLQPQQQQQAPQQPGSQQVQLRVSNDEANRAFCLSWLKAYYESVNGSSIQHEIMYKQYLASLHKLGRRDVISSQLYAACVRSLFGGSVGPVKRQLPDGRMDQFFEGVKIRANPLPFLRNLSTPASGMVQQPQPQAVQQPQPIQQQPVLPTQAQVQRPPLQTQTPQQPVQPQPQPQALRPKPQLQNQQQQQQPQPVQNQALPSSPILTNLLHGKNSELKANDQESLALKQQNSEENGTSVLDGILPAEGLGKVNKTDNHGMVNGVKEGNFKKMNGDDGNLSETSNLKRPASSDLEGAPPAKNLLVDATVINGNVDKAEEAVTVANSVPTSTTSTSDTPQNQNQTNKVVILQPNGPQPQPPVVNGQAHVNGNGTQNPQQQQTTAQPNLASPSSSSSPSAISPTPTTPTPPPATSGSSPPSTTPNAHTPFLCEWENCQLAFKTPKEVENHAIKVHCPLGEDDIQCLWQRCDRMKRKRFSLMTHIQDRHCHPQLMKLMAVRRVQMAKSGKSNVPLPPAPPAHPGYAPNAAFHAIKRHAAEFGDPKARAMADEKEGPVTKSVRLTSALILKNLVIYSSLGKHRLKAYESHLATVALSNVEASRTVSQILYDMTEITEQSSNR